MVEIIIKREMAIATGLDNRTFVVGKSRGILTDLSNGDILYDTTSRHKTIWDSLKESKQKYIIKRCLDEHKGLEEIMDEELKG